MTWAEVAFMVTISLCVLFLLAVVVWLAGRVRWLEVDNRQNWREIKHGLEAARAEIEAIRRTLRPGPKPKLGIARQRLDHDNEHLVN